MLTFLVHNPIYNQNFMDDPIIKDVNWWCFNEILWGGHRLLTFFFSCHVCTVFHVQIITRFVFIKQRLYHSLLPWWSVKRFYDTFQSILTVSSRQKYVNFRLVNSLLQFLMFMLPSRNIGKSNNICIWSTKQQNRAHLHFFCLLCNNNNNLHLVHPKNSRCPYKFIQKI